MLRNPRPGTTLDVLRVRLPSRRGLLLLGLAIGAAAWALDRLAELEWIEGRYLYDPTTDSVYVVGKASALEPLRPRYWLPLTSVPKSSVIWVEPWRQTVAEHLAARDNRVSVGGHSRRPLPAVDSVGQGLITRAGGAWEIAYVEDASVNDPARHLPPDLLERLPTTEEAEFWEEVIPVHAALISRTWSSTTRDDAHEVTWDAPKSRTLAPAILFRGPAARVFVTTVLGSSGIHRGVRISDNGEWTLVRATGPPR